MISCVHKKYYHIKISKVNYFQIKNVPGHPKSSALGRVFPPDASSQMPPMIMATLVLSSPGKGGSVSPYRQSEVNATLTHCMHIYFGQHSQFYLSCRWSGSCGGFSKCHITPFHRYLHHIMETAIHNHVSQRDPSIC